MPKCSPQTILHFWFHALKPEQWFLADKAIDQKISRLFTKITHAAAKGECSSWRYSIYGRLAEIIVLDQFSRNIWRNTPRAFQNDAMALALAQEAIKCATYSHLNPVEKQFILLPFSHSESVLIQKEALTLFAEINNPTAHEFAVLHKKIIDRFGRYPHRNKILGRHSTPEEARFLLEPNSSF